MNVYLQPGVERLTNRRGMFRRFILPPLALFLYIGLVIWVLWFLYPPAFFLLGVLLVPPVLFIVRSWVERGYL